MLSRATQRLPFLATIPRFRGGRFFYGLVYFALDTYLIVLSVKQSGLITIIYIYIYIYNCNL